MQQPQNDVPTMVESASTDVVRGAVKWRPLKSIWYLSHLSIAILGGVLTFSWSALLIFLASTALTICLGHSLGMHRKLIHRSYQCPQWLEYLFVYFGVLVGMAGPFGMIKQHDIRDWAQRKARCHSFLRHGESIWVDAWWQLNCDIVLDYPPIFKPSLRLTTDTCYRFLEKTWMLQQLPWAVLLFFCGGTAWVIWGISVRIFVSLTGHWLIGYFAHNSGKRDWHIDGAAVQGHNIPIAAYLTMGEAWHNNHHAFPGSAVFGLTRDQPDPGWWILKLLMGIRLVWNAKQPGDLPHRPELQALGVCLQTPCEGSVSRVGVRERAPFPGITSVRYNLLD